MLDQDNTIYMSKELRTQFRQYAKRFYLANADVEEQNYEKWISEISRKHSYNWYNLLQSLNIHPHKFADEVIDRLEVENFLSRDDKLISALEELSLPIYIVTASTPKFSQRVRITLGIEHLIKQAYIVNFPTEDVFRSQNKIDYYNLILENEFVQPSEVCIFGDSYLLDLKDAELAGFNTVLVGRDRVYKLKIDKIYEINNIIRQLNTSQ